MQEIEKIESSRLAWATQCLEPDMMMYCYNTSIGDVKVGGPRVQEQPQLHNELQGQPGVHKIINNIKQIPPQSKKQNNKKPMLDQRGLAL